MDAGVLLWGTEFEVDPRLLQKYPQQFHIIVQALFTKKEGAIEGGREGGGGGGSDAAGFGIGAVAHPLPGYSNPVCPSPISAPCVGRK
jgi:hypothetical protein